MELQALEAIYMDEYQRIEGVVPPAFELKLEPETGAGEDVNHVAVRLRVAYTPTYPEAAPEVVVHAIRGLEDNLVSELEALLRDASGSDELLGTAMVYALVERAQVHKLVVATPSLDLLRLCSAAPASVSAPCPDRKSVSASGSVAISMCRVFLSPHPHPLPHRIVPRSL